MLHHLRGPSLASANRLVLFYWSKDPQDFPNDHLVCQLPVHAAAIIYEEKDGWFMSNTGWDKKGLYIVPLKWKKQLHQ